MCRHVQKQIFPPYSSIYSAFPSAKPAYGALLFKRFEEEMPFNLIDTPALYRALNDLEKAEAMEAYWDTSGPGPAKNKNGSL